jgi:hypothetical protein
MSAHRIHLRGPWKLEQGTAPATPLKVRLPAEWGELFAGCSGSVRLSRTFHCPTNLAPTDIVELVFEDWPGLWTISLNQQPLAEFRDASAQSPQRIAVTPRLLPTNTLIAESRLAPTSDRETRQASFGTLALEIRTG